MDASKNTKFYYHADASAVGGWIKQPTAQVVSSPASISLAQAGGLAEKRTGRIRRGSFLSVGASHVHVSGHEGMGGGSWRTRVTATVEDLNILEVISAERIVAQISVVHRSDNSKPTISLLGTHFKGLHIAGTPVLPKYHTGISLGEEEATPEENAKKPGLPTFEDLMQVAVKHHNATKSPPAWLGTRLPTNHPTDELAKKGSALCSLIHHVPVTSPARNYAHVVHIPDFGNVFLGELMLGPAHFHLTMVRAEMGCMAEGDLSVCTAFSNGRRMP